MLTKKQIKDLPKGSYSNFELGQVFSNHGKKNREKILPIDRFGKVSSNIKSVVGYKVMRLSRKISKQYAN